MHYVVQFFGMVAFILGIAGAAFALLALNDGKWPIALAIAVYAVPSLLSGAALYCFGAIVEHLAAIRKSLDTPKV